MIVSKSISAKLDILPGGEHHFAGAIKAQGQHLFDSLLEFLVEMLQPKAR